MLRIIPVLCFASIASLLAGCSSSEVASEPRSKPLAEHEKSFDPGAYRKAEEKKTVEPAPVSEELKRDDARWVERVEKTMGYRIQLFSTTNIDEAQRQETAYRRSLDSLDLMNGRLDMTFDAPYYKVRLGDFLLRPPADSLRKVLHERGFPEAWVVRDRVERVIRVKLK